MGKRYVFGIDPAYTTKAIGYGDWTAGWPFDDDQGDLSPLGDIHITFAGGHCGDAACTRCDPMERMVGGLTVRECLERYEAYQRADYGGGTCANGGISMKFPTRATLTTEQLAAARIAWSAELRRKQAEARERERTAVVLESDD